MTATAVFEVGSEDDPVVQMAAALQAGSVTYYITYTNKTSYTFEPGLVAFKPLFSEGQKASTAFANYVNSSSANAGNPIVLANSLGYVFGKDCLYIRKLDPGETINMTLVLPTSTKLTYVSRIRGSDDDFISVNDTYATGSYYMLGYDLNAGKSSSIALGNTTVGAWPNIDGAITDLTTCNSSLVMSNTATLVEETFNFGPWDHSWPFTIGFEGDFNGDWYTDGKTARMIDVNAKLPTITGFVKLFHVCPKDGATFSAYADVATRYTKADSDTTLVLYFFDANGNVISTAENYPLHGRNDRRHALYDVAIPKNTRRIAVVPMGYFAQGETDSAHYYNLSAKYEPPAAVTKTALASDDFSAVGTSTFGSNQPNGWSDYGSDWYTNPSDGHATAWNPAWSNNAASLPLDTGMQKSFSLGAAQANRKLSVRAFAASTFTDPASYVQLRVKFNTGEEVSASAIATNAWGFLDVYRTAIPATATSAQVTLQVYFAKAETSSAYVDDLSLTIVK